MQGRCRWRWRLAEGAEEPNWKVKNYTFAGDFMDAKSSIAVLLTNNGENPNSTNRGTKACLKDEGQGLEARRQRRARSSPLGGEGKVEQEGLR